MGILRVSHLAVLSPDFFNVLARRGSDLLFTDDAELAARINVRHFAREGEAQPRRLPIARIESFNSVPEQHLFAMAAVGAGMAGRLMQRDLGCLQNGQTLKVPLQRREHLASALHRLAALPKTRLRLPSGTQHLLADPVEALLQQTEELNSHMLEMGLAAYAPKGASFDFPNARALLLDRQDSLARGGMAPVFLQQQLIEGLREPSTALMFNQLQANRRSGTAIYADLSAAGLVPRTELSVQGGARYLVTNPPEAVASALRPLPATTAPLLVVPPRKVLN